MQTVELGQGIVGSEGLGMVDVVGIAHQEPHTRHREQRLEHTPGWKKDTVDRCVG